MNIKQLYVIPTLEVVVPKHELGKVTADKALNIWLFVQMTYRQPGKIRGFLAQNIFYHEVWSTAPFDRSRETVIASEW
jgi:hypothetical protein